MVNKDAPLELYDPDTGVTYDAKLVGGVVPSRQGDYIQVDKTTPLGFGQYRISTGESVVPDANNWVLRNKKVDVNLVDLINNAGWVIARLGQDDNQLWHFEIREGYATSFQNVMIGDGFAFMDEALNGAFEKISKFNKLKALAKELGITGKVNI